MFSTTTVMFLGHIVDKFGIRADPEKTMAINKMAQPTNVTELRRFMGMINQLGKFSQSCIHYPTVERADELKVTMDMGPCPGTISVTCQRSNLYGAIQEFELLFSMY